ncbi:MAG: hypothetical protein MJ237_01685 [bacterium]|nr:hypothetical protein [bacterium]
MKKFIIILIFLSFVLPANAFFWDKKDKALELELDGKGYAGTLPDLNEKYKKDEQKVGTPIFESQKDFNDPSELKPVPRENPAYIDIIMKKDKTSEYVKDANEIISIIEKLVDCIEDENNVQLFVTRANVLTMNLDHLMQKYDSKPESYYESFRKLVEINQYTKSIAQLRREAQIYQRYLAYQASGSIYNPENINQQIEYLKEELNRAVILLRQEN